MNNTQITYLMVAMLTIIILLMSILVAITDKPVMSFSLNVPDSAMKDVTPLKFPAKEERENV